jgi:hypothetical protein
LKTDASTIGALADMPLPAPFDFTVHARAWTVFDKIGNNYKH